MYVELPLFFFAPRTPHPSLLIYGNPPNSFVSSLAYLFYPVTPEHQVAITATFVFVLGQ